MKARLVKEGRKYAIQEFVGIGWATVGTFKDGKTGTLLFDKKKDALAYCERMGHVVEV